ncbi:MAG: site-2 protease family protein [Planctomycetota bacterium]
MEPELWVQILLFVGVGYSVILHEIAHALSAYWCGDDTAYLQRRISLSPVTHIHPVGTVLVPLLCVFTSSGVFFGWANPVPVNPRKLRHPIRDDIIVSLAGIVANLCIALLLCMMLPLLISVGAISDGSSSRVLLIRLAFINVFLALFNLLPVPPLDGSHVLKYVLPRGWRMSYERLGWSGVLILMALLWYRPLGFGSWVVATVAHVVRFLLTLAGQFWSLFGI